MPGDQDAKPGQDADEAISDGEGDPSTEKTFIGTVAESKDLFAKFDKDQNRSWSHSPPDGLEEAAENEKTLKYAVLVRKMKPKAADSIKALEIDSIVIQSPYLKFVLGQIFKDYPGVVTDVSRLIFSAPFAPFVHRWDRFVEVKNDESHDEDTKTHLALLYDIMHAELKDIIQSRNDYFRNRAVTWDHVWTIFPPKSNVLTMVRDKAMAVRFESGEFKETNCGFIYDMTCHSVDWDGKTMGWADATQQIPKYAGTLPFNELPCCPFDYLSDPDGMRQVLVARGRIFESLAGIHYKYYDGIAAYHPDATPKDTRLEPVSGRVVIDRANWSRANPIYARQLRPLHQAYDHKAAEANDTMRYLSRRGFDPWSSSSNDAASGYKPATLNNTTQAKLSDEHLLLTSPMARGYSLMTKRWMEFFVDDVADIAFDTKAFDSLVLEKEQKRLILAFAQSQVRNKAAFDDVISGKGRGIIIMLSGGPGIGKTLTAESVAEEMRAPLYSMSAGDLGSDQYDIEHKLNTMLDMVAKWNAVLLLDECDIFLEQRTPNDLARNTIVGVFLRMLEYYQGILFMTTNRVKNIDAAFHSRIHLSLPYPELDAEARSRVWKTFLDKVGASEDRDGNRRSHEVTEEEIARLSKLDLNGRQIKNVLKMASLLPLQAEEPLEFGHVHSVLQVQGYSL